MRVTTTTGNQPEHEGVDEIVGFRSCSGLAVRPREQAREPSVEGVRERAERQQRRRDPAAAAARLAATAARPAASEACVSRC